MIKCLAFDLDGTLLMDDKTMDPRTVDSIKQAMAKGIQIVIASGRDKNGCRFVYEPLGLEEGNNYLALVNGQIIYDFKNKEYDLDDVLMPEDGIKIQQICKKFDVEGIFCCGYDFYSYLSTMNRLKKKIKEVVAGKPMDYGLKSEKFFKQNLDALKEALSDYDVLMVGPAWMEIMPKGVSKASALEKIAAKNGYTMNEVMAFGDAENDIQMLKRAGVGVAMGNAMDEVKEIADIITDTNLNNGIGKIIDKMVLGK